ncbi:MAG: lycopene cyclase family protein [Flavobacteriaceae bacterium]|nr:lycopene cyclase family protein [Flavobacteriaceae bacterium]
MNNEKQYTFIFAGAGAATLQILGNLLECPQLSNANILIIEQDSQKKNDRTWCFWEPKEKMEWTPYVVKEWEKIQFSSSSLSLNKSLSPLTYKMIRSEAYYKTMHERIRQHRSIDVVYDAVIGHHEEDERVTVRTTNNTYLGTYFFNSVFDWGLVQNQKRYPVLQQHFVGWFIKTELDHFDPTTATFMDFCVPQLGNTRFMYVLPLSKNEALVEYTLFSKDRLKRASYEREIRRYLNTKNIRNYTISETEEGSIPMTSYPFSKHNTKRVMHIGSAGGWTKASTGFTFTFIERKAASLVLFLKENKDLSLFEKRNRFWWYDLLFLDVLARYNNKGTMLFSRLFERTQLATIFRFLDEKSSLGEEVRIMRSFPVGLFIMQLIRRLMRAFH